MSDFTGTMHGMFRNPVKPGDPPQHIVPPELQNQPAPDPLPDGPRTVKALANLAKAEEREAAQLAQVAAREAELADLERRAADDVLDSTAELAPAMTEKLVGQTARLRGAVELERRVAAKAADRTAAVRREVLGADLEDVKAARAEIARRKGKHDQRLRQLLDDLTAHDGATYTPARGRLEQDRYQAAAQPEASWSRSALLADELIRFDMRIEILQAAVDGQPLPVMKHSMTIAPNLFSRRVRGPEAFPEFR